MKLFEIHFNETKKHFEVHATPSGMKFCMTAAQEGATKAVIAELCSMITKSVKIAISKQKEKLQ
jgi:hypothetical protein